MSSIEPESNARSVSRRRFLSLCAGTSAAVALRPSVPVASAQPTFGTKAGAGGGAPKKGGTLRVGFYIEAATVDPHLSGSKIDRQMYHNIYEPLVVLDANLGIKPGLAESWQQPEPQTLICQFRRGVKFHDGTDFNAEAARFNFTRMIAKKGAATRALPGVMPPEGPGWRRG